MVTGGGGPSLGRRDADALGFELVAQDVEQVAGAEHLQGLCPVRACGISRRPRPMTCSGRISALAVNGRRPSTTVTFFTSQPSRSIITLTMALVLFSGLSMSRATCARLLEVALGDLALGVRVDHEDFGLLEAELLGLPEVLAQRVGVDVLLRHDEEHRLGVELLVDAPVVLPALDGSTQPVAVLLGDVVLGDALSRKRSNGSLPNPGRP